jgi:hypothetical protein
MQNKLAGPPGHKTSIAQLTAPVKNSGSDFRKTPHHAGFALPSLQFKIVFSGFFVFLCGLAALREIQSINPFAPRAILRYTQFMTLDSVHTTCIGIDIAPSRRPFSYAALGSDKRLLAMGQCQILEMLAFISGQQQALIALNAPFRPNQGLMQQDEVRAAFAPRPTGSHWTDLRVAEYQLHAAGITVPHTPAREKDCHGWQRHGFTLAQNFSGYGFQQYASTEDAPLQMLETQTDAIFHLLTGHAPAEDRLLEGRLQRQMLLHEHDMPVTDPMDLFEEITRFRLLKGELAINNVLSTGELNALMAAWLAWLAVNEPGKVQKFGTAEEGEIYLPLAKEQGF